MPAGNITLTALWDCAPSSSSPFSFSSRPQPSFSSSTGAIVGGVVGAIAAVAIVVLVVLFVLLAPKRGRRRSDDDEEEDGIGMKQKNQHIVEKASDASTASRGGGGGPSYVSVGEAIAKSYAQPYKAKGIAEALRSAGLDEDRASLVVEECIAAASQGCHR